MTATKNSPGELGTAPENTAFEAVYAFLSSIRFAIFVLSFIAAACVVGTAIPQGAPVQAYLEHYEESTYAVLKFLGLTDVFHSPWFLFLMGLFVVNLVLCSLKRLTAFLKGRQQGLPGEKTLLAMPLSFFLKGMKIGQASALFRGYRNTVVPGGRVLEKGRISRYGVFIIHGSILIILAGSLIGLMTGYRGAMTLTKGETKDDIVKRGGPSAVPLGFGVRLDDFKVSFYPGGEPREYVSTIEIVEGGKAVRKAEVRVNHPLSYRGTNIYQASYGSDPVFSFDIGGQEVRLSQGGTYKKDGLNIMVVRFERSIHNFGPGVEVAYLQGGETRTSWFVRDVPTLRQREIMGVPVRLDNVGEEFYTGLEISRDPGVWVVWTGFALILFGLYGNFFIYYRRIYLLETAEGVLVAGASTKNKEAFREEFEKWREKTNGGK